MWAARGVGVFARRAFVPSEFIFRRRRGRIVRNVDIPRLPADEQRHLCELDFETSAVLLPPGCYLNHSCQPNAMRSGVKVFAWQPIAPGVEITIDYRLNAFDDESIWCCLCGAPSCTGTVVGSFFALPVRLQHEYLRFAPRFIQREFRARHGTASHPSAARLTVPAIGTEQRPDRQADR